MPDHYLTSLNFYDSARVGILVPQTNCVIIVRELSTLKVSPSSSHCSCKRSRKTVHLSDFTYHTWILWAIEPYRAQTTHNSEAFHPPIKKEEVSWILGIFKDSCFFLNECIRWTGSCSYVIFWVQISSEKVWLDGPRDGAQFNEVVHKVPLSHYELWLGDFISGVRSGHDAPIYAIKCCWTLPKHIFCMQHTAYHTRVKLTRNKDLKRNNTKLVYKSSLHYI